MSETAPAPRDAAASPPGMAQLPPHTRLSPPTFTDEVAPVYARALDALAQDGVPFMLGGAIAFNAYTGIWRDTKDLDVFCRPEDAPRALAALARDGMRTETVYESWLAKAWDGDVFVDLIWRNANGLFPVRASWIEHAPHADILGRRVRVLPLEELLLSKMMVGGRYRFDGADMLHVLHAAGDRVDWDRLADGAGEHVGLMLAYLHMYRWGYPGSADRVPEAVLERYARLARERPSTLGPFRALLLDIQSYRVDVEGWGLPDPHKAVLEGIFGDAEGRR
ncbi:MAG TPA: nucleotidyltransferase family protein [Candidatus Thermoplasmatota archaeon]|nr:nucleotidyltransferase family protein [Candidatus Thermoplasmatota archaeon]